MLEVKLTPELDSALSEHAKRERKSKTSLVQAAVVHRMLDSGVPRGRLGGEGSAPARSVLTGLEESLLTRLSDETGEPESATWLRVVGGCREVAL